jgi:hypothetical protein
MRKGGDMATQQGQPTVVGNMRGDVAEQEQT